MPNAADSLSTLQSTLRAARFRLALARAGDFALMGMWVALGLLVMIAIAGWLGVLPLMDWMFWLPLIGAIVGAGTSLYHPPTLMDAAARLDQRHRLQDLLLSAWSVHAPRLDDARSHVGSGARPSDRLSETPDAWSDQLLRLAAASAARVTLPNLVGRYAPRLHAATWLLAVATLAGTYLSIAPASANQSAMLTQRERAKDATRYQSGRAPLTSSHETATQMRQTSNDPEAPPTIAGKGSPRTGDGANDAQGPGRANSVDPITGNPIDRTAINAHSTPTGTNTGAIATGSGQASDNATAGASAAAGRVARGPVAATPPWELDTWPARRDAALERIAQGRVPDAYQPLVREYFAR
jgi:hypothetical protein